MKKYLICIFLLLLSLLSLFGCSGKNETGNKYLFELEEGWSIRCHGELPSHDGLDQWTDIKWIVTEIDSAEPVYCMLMNLSTEKGYLNGYYSVAEKAILPPSGSVYYVLCSRSPFTVSFENNYRIFSDQLIEPEPHIITACDCGNITLGDAWWYISEIFCSLDLSCSTFSEDSVFEGTAPDIIPFDTDFVYDPNEDSVDISKRYITETFTKYMTDPTVTGGLK